METVLIIFMVFVGVMCVFSATTVTLDIVQDFRKKRCSEKAQTQPQSPERKEPPVEPIVDPAVTEQTAVEDEIAAAVAEDENAIVFSAGTSETLEEKYLALSSECKGYYDEIVRYAMAQPEAKRVKNARYEEYKIRRARLVRLLIKRGVVICEFVLLNNDFRNFINDNKLQVKQAPTVLKIQSPEAVQAAKNSIDIAVKAVAEEAEYKKAQQRAKRRLAREQKNQDNDG